MNEADPKILKHGKEGTLASSSPLFGHTLQTTKVRLSLAPPVAIDVAFQSPEDTITTVFSLTDVEIAINSDRFQSATTLPNRFNFHPAESAVRARTVGQPSSVLQFVFAPGVRRTLVRDLSLDVDILFEDGAGV